MKDQIINYVNKVFKGIPDTKENKIQKSELIENLSDKVIDLVNEGHNEELAIMKVIHEFGSVREARKEFGLDKIRNKKMKFRLIFMSVLLLVLLTIVGLFLVNTKAEGYITDIYATNNSVQFDVTIIDEYNVIKQTKIILYENGLPTQVQDIPLKEMNETKNKKALKLDNVIFNQLNSETSYELKIETSYKFGFGKILNKVLASKTFTTKSNTVPTVTLRTSSTWNSITIHPTFYNPDQVVIEDYTVVLKRDDTEIEVTHLIDQNVTIFYDELPSSTHYEIKVYANMNLNNGNKTLKNQLIGTATVITETIPTPRVTFSDITATVNSISATIKLYDNENVVKSVKANLYSKGILRQSIDLGKPAFDKLITFNNLLQDEPYSVVIRTVLTDGIENEYEEVVASRIIKTSRVELLPSASIYNQIITTDSISMDVLLVDINNLLMEQNVVLYKDGVELERKAITVGENHDIIFTQLQSNTTYEVKVECLGNYGDGKGTNNRTLIKLITTTP